MRRRCVLISLVGFVAVFGGRLVLLAAASGTPNAAATGKVARVGSGQHRAAIVFGAALNRDGSPSALLRDRIRAGVALMKGGSVDLLLMTGDNSRTKYSEPSAMRTAAIALGADPDRIALDYGGRRTWDSCDRAAKVFGVHDAIVVSNDFHRARTIALCKAAKIHVVGAVGTSTAKYPVVKRGNWELREVLASWRGLSDAWIAHPKVAVGGPAIDPYDPCALWASFSPEDQAQAKRPSSCPRRAPTTTPAAPTGT